MYIETKIKNSFTQSLNCKNCESTGKWVINTKTINKQIKIKGLFEQVKRIF